MDPSPHNRSATLKMAALRAVHLFQSMSRLCPCAQDECGLSQTGFPLSGGLGFGAVFAGCFGARAAFFCRSEIAAASRGVGCPDEASVGDWCVGGAAFGSEGPAPCCVWPLPRPAGFEGVLFAEAVIASCRSASSQISVSQSPGHPRSRQICCARWETASCVGEFVFMGLGGK
jgi:hypothetical protein